VDPLGLRAWGKWSQQKPRTPQGGLTVGAGGSFMYGPGGLAANTSAGIDSKGRICVQFTRCGRVGMGYFGGLGMSASASSGDFCEGTVSTEGAFVEGGSVFGGSGSVSSSDDSSSSISGGYGGVAGGVAGGKEFCKVTTICLN